MDHSLDQAISLKMEEYLTIRELSQWIKMSPGTIRNLIWKGEFKLNIHFIKPTPRKVLFIAKEVEDWLHESSTGVQRHHPQDVKGLINI